MSAYEDVKEKDAVDELKKRMKRKMKSEMHEDDFMFYRFLKARDFNVDNAEKMLIKHLEWRKKYDVDNVTKYVHPEVLKKYLPFIMLGYDKEGSVIRYCPAGNIDWIGLDLSVKQEEFAKLLISDIYEDETELKRQSEKLGKTVDKCFYIYDLEHLTFAQAINKRVIMNTIFVCNLYQNNYPERLKDLYVINASYYFSLLFSVIKHFLSNSVLDKVKIYSDDSYKEDLLKKVDADVLPAFLGGKRTDPDGNPLCPSFINRGGPVPETYFIHKSKRSLANLPDTKKIALTSAAFHEVYQEVKESGSFLEWEFQTKCRDIGFGLFYEDTLDGEKKMTELISIQRIDTNDYAETGMYRCEKSGTYVFVFDNTYSWMRGKEIFYRFEVVTPEEQETDSLN